MEKDYVLEQVKQKVSKVTKVNQLEVDKAIDITFKGLNQLLSSGVKRVKIPHLGTFREKRNLKEDGDNRGTVYTGGTTTSDKPGSEVNQGV